MATASVPVCIPATHKNDLLSFSKGSFPEIEDEISLKWRDSYSPVKMIFDFIESGLFSGLCCRNAMRAVENTLQRLVDILSIDSNNREYIS